MEASTAIILGLVQALTEFLPVSSSGHLVVFQSLLGAQAATLAFDVLLHLATLLVVIWYLKEEILEILKNLASSPEARQVVLLIIIATIPGAAVGLGLKDLIHEAFGSTRVVAVGFAVTTLLLIFADWKQRKYHEKSSPTKNAELFFSWPLPSLTQALIIGVAQALAITPGISRSGSTIAACLLLGLPVSTALKFSFLISIPAILGAGVLEAEALSALEANSLSSYALGFVTAATTGYFALKMLIVVAKSRSLRYFAVYTGVLAVVTGLWL